MTQHRVKAKIVSLATTLVFLLSQGFAATTGPQLPDPGSAPLSHEQQIQLGSQASQEVYKQMPVLPDSSPETQYIRQVGQRLVAVIPSQYSWPFEFHSIPEKEINAFALPGGPMFVNLGTITAASNEAELAGVMAHEMAHVYLQHSAKQVGKQQTTAALAGIVGAILGAASHGVLSQLAQAGIQFGAQGIIMKYSRDDEAQADAVGAIIMYKAGYNPQAMADFFQKLAAEGGGGPQFLSDHPNPGNREAAIQKEIAGWPARKYQTTSAGFTRAKQQVQSTRLYNAQEIAAGGKSGQWAQMNKQNGAYKNVSGTPVSSTPGSATSGNGTATVQPVSLQSVLPSSQMRNENLGPLSIAHPENWQVMAPQQQGQDVRIAPAAGVSGNSVGYGVVLNSVRPKNGQSMDIDQLTDELVKAMQQGGGDLQPIGDEELIRVAGVRGRSLKMKSTSPFADANGRPQEERDWLVTVPRQDGSFVYFVFVAPLSQWERFKPSFEAMLRSVQFQQ
jgi:Zn-dependent protease with chaperone function